MLKENRRYILIAAFGLSLAIIIGAFAAHALKNLIPVKDLEIFETGNKYQVYGFLGMLLMTILSTQSTVSLKRPILLLLTGIILFSGSLYLLSIRTLLSVEGINRIGAITPFGGLCMILSWIWLGIIFSKRSKPL
ncbi:MAG: DUF423 domain-containing protein [Flavobacteriales bacterium]|nr:DUF423 domain-containing protein [Flavobacteriales bacterium]